MSRQESLSKAAKDLMLKEPYYGIFLIMLNKIWSKAIPTAAVGKNGINYQLIINEDFWDSLGEFHKLGILKHELLHVAFGHLTTYFRFTNKKLANIAMDMEINQYLEKGWLPGDEYTKEQYDKIVADIKERVSLAIQNQQMTEEEAKAEFAKIPGRGILIEDYDELKLDRKAGCRYYYDKLREAKEKKDSQGSSGCSNFDKLCDQMDQNDPTLPEHNWDEFEGLTETEEKLMQKQVQRLLAEAKEQTIKKRGTVPGEMESLIVLEEVVKPKFDWRNYVKRFAGISTRVYTKKTRRKENRRFSENPGIKIKMRQKILVALDTSGSVSDSELLEFMNEIYHIYKGGVDISIVQCDTHVRNVIKYNGSLDLAVFGRGGTYFDPVLEYFNDHRKEFTSLIYCTDGECSASVKPAGPVLWVLSERSSMNDSLPGKVIKLDL